MPNQNNHDSKMTWLMIIFCSLPLLILVLTGNFFAGYKWFAILAIGLFVVGHFWLMHRGHHGPQQQDNDESHAHSAQTDYKKSNGQSDKHRGGCCH